MDRVYFQIIKDHLKNDRQMIFLSGPRQCGKTTIALMAEQLSNRFVYLNWDNASDRQKILAGPEQLADFIGVHDLSEDPLVVVFDEIHKFGSWKNYLKGFFDSYGHETRIIVTGSSRLNVYKRGGDSLMGRYFPYRVHPLTLAEIVRPVGDMNLDISPPVVAPKDILENLMEFGGFPEPYLKQNKRFSNRWKKLRYDQLFKEDIRDLSRVQDIGHLEILAEFLKNQSGQLVNYSSLAVKVSKSADTIKNWIEALGLFYYCFVLRPWKRNIPRSLIKEPKVFLWDWSLISDKGQRFENLLAVHLIKAVQIWSDLGLGDYQLFFIRDKEKREVDFLVTKNDKPWFLVEAKSNDEKGLSPQLAYFQKKINAPYAFQVSLDGGFVKKDCFSIKGSPVKVPAMTFLSQLR